MLIAAAGYFVGKRGRDKRNIAGDAPENEKTGFDVEPEDNQTRGELDSGHMRRPELHGQQAPTAELPTGIGEAERKA